MFSPALGSSVSYSLSASWGLKVDHSPPSRMSGSCTSTGPARFHARTGTTLPFYLRDTSTQDCQHISL